jgi:hypothetical protein
VSQVCDGRVVAGAGVADVLYCSRQLVLDAGGCCAEAAGTVVVDTVRPIVSNVGDSPDSFSPRLGQITTISFTISEPVYVTLRIYNSAGILVATLLSNSLQPAGSPSVMWTGKIRGVSVKTGMYTYRLWSWDAAGHRHASPYPAIGTIAVK